MSGKTRTEGALNPFSTDFDIMPRPYNLRKQNLSPNYKEPDNEEDDSDEEEVGSKLARQNRSSGYRAPSDDSRFNSSGRDSSGLSTTVSDSFSYHNEASPSPRTDSEKLYPDLSSIGGTGSPVSRRREIHKHDRSLHLRPERAFPNKGQGKSSPRPSRLVKKKAEEQSVLDILTEYLILFLAVSAIVILIMFMIMNRSSTEDAQPLTNTDTSDFEMFCERVDGLKEQFPNQNVRFWKVIKACTRHVFDPEVATYPAVLLIVGEKKHAIYASRIAEAVRQEFESIRLKSSSYADGMLLNLTSSSGGQDVDEQKLFLDEWLKDRLDNEHVAVIVNHLESLLPEAALLLHGYCDGDNAPFKEAMLIFGLFLDHPVDSDWAAEKALGNLWMTEYMRDKVGALLSLVANNIVLVTGPNE